MKVSEFNVKLGTDADEDLIGSTESYIMPPGLGILAGPLGALALAADAHAAAG